MSAWQAHCLPWQSLMMNPALHSGQKWLRKHIECRLIQSKMFPWKRDVWIRPVSSASNELTYIKMQHSCFCLKVYIQNKMQQGEPGFYSEMGKVKGSQGRPGEPCLQGSYQSSGGGMSPIHRAHKPSLFTRCKCACMRGNTYASSTYNRESIIASLLESREKNNLRPELADIAAKSEDI